MKKKIGELYDKPIVIGNPNEFNKNEIALSDLGGDSIDDGMEYYEINAKFFENDDGNLNGMLNSFFITSIVDGKLKVGAHYSTDEVAHMCGNAKIVLYGDVTGKNQLNSQLEQYGTSLDDTSTFKPITAKEYYSLIKN